MASGRKGATLCAEERALINAGLGSSPRDTRMHVNQPVSMERARDLEARVRAGESCVISNKADGKRVVVLLRGGGAAVMVDTRWNETPLTLAAGHGGTLLAPAMVASDQAPEAGTVLDAEYVSGDGTRDGLARIFVFDVIRFGDSSMVREGLHLAERRALLGALFLPAELIVCGPGGGAAPAGTAVRLLIKPVHKSGPTGSAAGASGRLRATQTRVKSRTTASLCSSSTFPTPATATTPASRSSRRRSRPSTSRCTLARAARQPRSPI